MRSSIGTAGEQFGQPTHAAPGASIRALRRTAEIVDAPLVEGSRLLDHLGCSLMSFGLPTVQHSSLSVPMRGVAASLFACLCRVPAHLLGTLLRHSSSFLKRR